MPIILIFAVAGAGYCFWAPKTYLVNMKMLAGKSAQVKGGTNPMELVASINDGFLSSGVNDLIASEGKPISFMARAQKNSFVIKIAAETEDVKLGRVALQALAERVEELFKQETQYFVERKEAQLEVSRKSLEEVEISRTAKLASLQKVRLVRDRLESLLIRNGESVEPNSEFVLKQFSLLGEYIQAEEALLTSIEVADDAVKEAQLELVDAEEFLSSFSPPKILGSITSSSKSVSPRVELVMGACLLLGVLVGAVVVLMRTPHRQC